MPDVFNQLYGGAQQAVPSAPAAPAKPSGDVFDRLYSRSPAATPAAPSAPVSPSPQPQLSPAPNRPTADQYVAGPGAIPPQAISQLPGVFRKLGSEAKDFATHAAKSAYHGVASLVTFPVGEAQSAIYPTPPNRQTPGRMGGIEITPLPPPPTGMVSQPPVGMDQKTWRDEQHRQGFGTPISQMFQPAREASEALNATIGATPPAPAKTVGAEAGNVAGGLAAFLVSMGVARSTLGPYLDKANPAYSPRFANIIAGELVNQANGGKPGEGAAQMAAFEGIGAIPAKRLAMKFGKVAFESGALAGLSKLQGDSNTAAAINALIPVGMHALGMSGKPEAEPPAPEPLAQTNTADAAESRLRMASQIQGLPPRNAEAPLTAPEAKPPVPPIPSLPEPKGVQPRYSAQDLANALPKGEKPPEVNVSPPEAKVTGITAGEAGKIAPVNEPQGAGRTKQARNPGDILGFGGAGKLGILEEIKQSGKYGPSTPSANDPSFALSGNSLSDLTTQIRKLPSDNPASRIEQAAQIGESNPGPSRIGKALGSVRGAIAALFDAYKNPVKTGGYHEAVRKWSGAENKSALLTNQFLKRVRREIPNALHRQAIGIYMESGGDQAVLDTWAREIAANPRTQKYAHVFTAAANLSDDAKAVANAVHVHNDATLQEAMAAGMLKQGVDNYLMHIWKDDATLRRLLAESNYASLITKPGFTKQRVIPTYFDGLMKGMHPQTLDFADLTAAHERSMRQALAARDFIKSLNNNKAADGRPLTAVSWASAKLIPDGEVSDRAKAYFVNPNLKPAEEWGDYRVIDHPALRGWRWAATSAEGSPVFVQGDMLVHPEIYQHLKNNLTRSGFQTFELRLGNRIFHPGRAVLAASSEIKHAILALSAFHQTTLGAHALEHRTAPAFMPKINLDDPVDSRLIDSGLMVAHYDAMDAFGEGVASGGLVTKIPLIGPAYHAYVDYLFKDYLPRVKMAMAKKALARNLKRYAGKMPEDDIYALTANQSNAAFGGLNMRSLGRNKTFQDTLRLILMAPDFTEARARFVGQSVKPGGREQLVALGIGAAALYTACAVLNQLLDGNPHLDKPFVVVVGNREYSLRTIQGDLVHLAEDPIQFLKNRLSPPANFTVQSLAKVNRFGEKTGFAQQVKDAAKGNVPIPAQAWTEGGSRRTPGQRIAQTVLKMVGVNDSYTEANDSEAVQFLNQYKRKRASELQMNSDERQRHELRRSIIESLQKDESKGKAALRKAVADGKIPKSQIDAILLESRRSKLAQRMYGVPTPVLLQAWSRMTADEKKEAAPLIATSLRHNRTMSDADRRAAMSEITPRRDQRKPNSD